MTRFFHISYSKLPFPLLNTEAHSDYSEFDNFASGPPFLSEIRYSLSGFQPLQSYTSKDKKSLLVIPIWN